MQAIQGVHHVAIIASDYQASKSFYIEALGMRVVSEVYREERRSYKLNLAFADGVEIELFSFPDPPARPTRPEACGLRHLALRVSDIDSLLSHLRSMGVAHEEIRIDELTGARFCFFSDPDGLPIELYQLA
jgi:glyoxylase I family protein